MISCSSHSKCSLSALPQTKGWEATRLALMYVHDNFLRDFSFFIKASDHNYVVVENLRALLHQMDPNEPLLIGRQTIVSCALTLIESISCAY